jgi:hypothetical protein
MLHLVIGTRLADAKDLRAMDRVRCTSTDLMRHRAVLEVKKETDHVRPVQDKL